MRSFIRHPADIPIQIQVEYLPDSADSEMNNVSLGGLACESHTPLEKGAEVCIRVPFLKPAVEARGSVVWCHMKTEGIYEVGIEFAEPDDAYTARMIEQVCYIERYKKEIREREGRVLNGEEAAREWIRKYAAGFPA